MATPEEILDSTRSYFLQQSEIYGKEFHLDVDLRELTSKTPLISMASFYEQIKDCQKCSLSSSRTNFVFGVGSENAELMCVGEAPGQEEDKQGEPFVGAAGQLLNKILSAIGFQRREVYIANIIKCRPPGNRNPDPDEIAECLPYLKKQIELIRPRLILALGRVAAQTLLATDESLATLRKTTHTYEGIRVVVTYHPAALLRNPQWKRATWEDVQKLRQIYDEIVGDKPPLQASEKT